MYITSQARSQDFLCVCVCVCVGGGGGGRTSRTGAQSFNVRMIRYASSENTQGRVTNLWTNWNGVEF